MKTQHTGIDQIKKEYLDEYQNTLDALTKRTRDFVSDNFSEGMIEQLGRTLQLISLEYSQFYSAEEALDQIYQIGRIIEFIKKTRLDFRNIEFYETEPEKDKI